VYFVVFPHNLQTHGNYVGY